MGSFWWEYWPSQVRGMGLMRRVGHREAPVLVLNWHRGSPLLRRHLPFTFTFCEESFWLGVWTCPLQMSWVLWLYLAISYQDVLPPALCLSSPTNFLRANLGHISQGGDFMGRRSLREQLVQPSCFVGEELEITQVIGDLRLCSLGPR